MTDIIGGQQITATPVLEGYGPKRVKTKTMDIEQFSPMELYKLEQLRVQSSPTFCSSRMCVGRGINELYYED